MTKVREGVDLDAILEELGECGRYQVMIYSLILVTTLFSAIHNCQYIFAAAEINYR